MKKLVTLAFCALFACCIVLSSNLAQANARADRADQIARIDDVNKKYVEYQKMKDAFLTELLRKRPAGDYHELDKATAREMYAYKLWSDAEDQL